MSRAARAPGHRTRYVVTTWLALLGWLAAATLTAAPAQAHAALVGTDPASGAVLDEVPRRVSLQFSEDIAPEFVTVNVRVAGGEPERVRTSVETTTVRAVLDGVSASSKPRSGATWQVDYRVVSVDGHPITGSLDFVAPTPAADPAETTADEREAPAEGGDQRQAVTTEPAASPSQSATAWAPTLTVGGITLAVVLVAVSVLVRGRRSES